MQVSMQSTQIDHQSRTASHHMGSNQAAHAQLATGKGMFEGMNGRFDIGSDGGLGSRHPLPQSSYLHQTAGDTIRKVLSHTVCVFINLQLGRSPLYLDDLVAA
jgi:hypothetical protein